jgi:hypothetical protein
MTLARFGQGFAAFLFDLFLLLAAAFPPATGLLSPNRAALVAATIALLRLALRPSTRCLSTFFAAVAASRTERCETPPATL